MTSARPYRAAISARRRAALLTPWLTLGLLAGLWAAAPVAPDTALATVAELHAGLLAAAEHREDPFAERYGLLMPLIVTTHDLGYIGQITIRRQWKTLNAQQQADFGAAFRRLAVANYVARFGGLRNASFEIADEEVLPRGRHQVSAVLRPAGAEPVTLNYVLHQTQEGHWKIINVVANGVSDLALKRAEYQRVLSESDFAGLLDHLNAQSQRLASPSAEKG
ncbi:MAG: ABC transporter substrate-binding protein [Gammaproteobacteria bacterium]